MEQMSKAAERELAESLIGKRVRVTCGRLASPRMGVVTGRHETTAGDQYVEIDFGGITDSALATSVTVVSETRDAAQDELDRVQAEPLTACSGCPNTNGTHATDCTNVSPDSGCDHGNQDQYRLVPA